MQDAPHESEAAIVPLDFKSCPQCKASTFCRLDGDYWGEFNYMSPKAGSSFLLALATWLLLALLTPGIIIWLWQPTKGTITPWQNDILQFLLILNQAGIWIASHVGFWVWVAVAAFQEFGGWFAGCPTCMRGFRFNHAFKANSFLSRVILAIISIANLRRKPWLGIASIITIQLMKASALVFALILALKSSIVSGIVGGWLGMMAACKMFGDNGRKIAWSATITAASCFLAGYFSQTIFLAVPPAALIGYWAMQDNRCSRLEGITRQIVCGAGLATIKRLPLLLILLIPGLCLKAGIDWSANHVLNAVEARAATIDTMTVPTIREEKFPWHSPLRWFGVPKYTRGTMNVSLEKPKEAFISVVKITRTLMDTLELISLAILTLLFGRALVSMLIRELIVQGVQLNAYVPAPREPLQHPAETTTPETEVPQPDEESRVPMEGHASLVIDQTWAASVFLKRDLSPTGGVPSTEMTASKMAFLARLIYHCLVMDRYALKDTTIQLDSSDGHRFVRWELKEGEVLYFNFAQVVGWTNAVRFDTALCLQVGMLAQGKVLVHRAYGPGSLIFDLHGEPGVWAHDKGATFTPDRLVACRIDVKQGDGHPDFKIIAAGGLLNSFIGTVSQQASIGTALLLDPKGRRASHSHPVFDLLRQTYTFFG